MLPSELQGCLVGGDLIRSINGIDIGTMPFNDVVDYIRTIPKGRFARFRILRAGFVPDLMPGTRIEHPHGHTDVGDSDASIFRGVYRRGDKWETAICLRPMSVSAAAVKSLLPVHKVVFLCLWFHAPTCTISWR